MIVNSVSTVNDVFSIHLAHGAVQDWIHHNILMALSSAVNSISYIEIWNLQKWELELDKTLTLRILQKE